MKKIPLSARMVTQAELITLARDLKSEHGENPEYDRALVELCADALGMPMDEKEKVARMIGIKKQRVRKATRAGVFAMVGYGFNQEPEKVQQEFVATVKKLLK